MIRQLFIGAAIASLAACSNPPSNSAIATEAPTVQATAKPAAAPVSSPQVKAQLQDAIDKIGRNFNICAKSTDAYSKAIAFENSNGTISLEYIGQMATVTENNCDKVKEFISSIRLPDVEGNGPDAAAVSDAKDSCINSLGGLKALYETIESPENMSRLADEKIGDVGSAISEETEKSLADASKECSPKLRAATAAIGISPTQAAQEVSVISPPPAAPDADAKNPAGRTPTRPVTEADRYVVLQRMHQAEEPNVEEAEVTVISCGDTNLVRDIYQYHRVSGPNFRAISPPQWGDPLGGRDFKTMSGAVHAACASA